MHTDLVSVLVSLPDGGDLLSFGGPAIFSAVSLTTIAALALSRSRHSTDVRSRWGVSNVVGLPVSTNVDARRSVQSAMGGAV